MHNENNTNKNMNITIQSNHGRTAVIYMLCFYFYLSTSVSSYTTILSHDIVDLYNSPAI